MRIQEVEAGQDFVLDQLRAVVLLELRVGEILLDAKGSLDVFEVFEKVRHGGQVIIGIE